MSEPMYVGEVDTETALAEAKERLAAFEAKSFGENKMARFRKEAPRHPILIGLALVGMGTGVCAVFGVLLAAAPLVSADLARTFSSMPGLEVLPVALVALAVCGAITWAALYGLAVMRAAQSPLLPHAVSEHNRLRSDVQRLQAQKEVSKRLTETPPPARMRSASY
jgi:hypothetical protein